MQHEHVYDFIIIGQGLAGTLMGYRLQKAGKSVFYLDAPEQTAASNVAAGIINPITGRRFVKSWRIDELLPAAHALYAELEAELDIKIHHQTPVVRTLFNRGDKNDWEVRGGDPGYAAYLDDDPELGNLREVTEAVFAYAGVRHSSRVDLALLTSTFSATSEVQHHSRRETVDYTRFDLTDGSVRYGDLHARNLLCCEGWRARHNPWFAYLPHRGAKGEVLYAEVDAAMPDLQFKHRIFLVPRPGQAHWVGATSENAFTDDSPTPAKRRFLEERLGELLTVPYRIVDHRAAVRPTVKDRRPLLGRHPEHDHLYIINGLGTKGASLAPLCSRWLLDFILHGKALPAEVDIQRFPLT